MKASEVPQDYIASVEMVKKRLRYHALPKKVEAIADPEAHDGATDSATTRYRKHQLDIRSKVYNFDSLIAVIENGPAYISDNPELSVDGLKAKAEALKQYVQHADDALREVQRLRAVRDAALYGPEGIYGRAVAVKGYLQGHFNFVDEKFRKAKQISFYRQSKK